MNSHNSKSPLELYILNYEKLHEIHQTEIKSAFTTTGLYLGATFATIGYIAAKDIDLVKNHEIFLVLAFVMLIHNLISERLSFRNEKREEQLKKLEKHFSKAVNKDEKANLPFSCYGIDFDTRCEKKAKRIGKTITIKRVYWFVFWIYFLLFCCFSF